MNNTIIEFVKEIKYLGFMITHNNRDETHLESMYRGLCVRSNMVLRNFSKCASDVKCLLFQSFCTSFYCLPLIFKFKVLNLNRLRVCYNNSIRKLFGVNRQTSVSALCVERGVPTFAEVHRKAVVSLLQRLKSSNNAIIKSLTNVNSFHTSEIYEKWKPIAYVN